LIADHLLGHKLKESLRGTTDIGRTLDLFPVQVKDAAQSAYP
jgi:hypothetical protein